MKTFIRTSAVAALLATMLAACGGDDGGGDVLAGGGTNTGSGSGSVMSCPTGIAACSGGSETGSTGAIKLSAYGVQTITASTNDLLATPGQRGSEATIAFGLAPLTAGLAEVRVAREPGEPVTALNLLLSGLNLSWDGTTERPLIVETFGLPRGRVQLGSTGMATIGALPPASDTTFWNNNPQTFAGTQANYANNLYFARQPLTTHCTADDSTCLAAADNGLRLNRGDWRDGGVRPDQVGGVRLHEDGATMAPDAIPFPGFKGYRDVWHWSYQHAHLTGWISQDTVNIVEWGGNDEHNKARRGAVAFGYVTDPASVPTTGSARYTGLLRGWYSPDGRVEAYPIAADVEITVDFTARNAAVRVFNLRVDEAQDPSPQLATESTNTLPFATNANTLIGPAIHGDASGHAGARFFGPVSNGAPPEIAGTFSVRGSSTSPIVDAIFGAGGFIAKRAPDTLVAS